MLAYFASLPDRETNGVVAGTRTIAMNGLGAAGYGKRVTWRSDGERGKGDAATAVGRPLNFLDAIAIIADNIVPATILAPWLCKLPIMPASVRRIGEASAAYTPNAEALLREERFAVQSTTKEAAMKSNSLIRAMVRISDDAKARGSDSGKTALHLTEDEIHGSLFQFTVAGYDTTANTLAYAFVRLAVHPEWQAWLAEEVDAVMPNPEATYEYERAFPKLPRCLAFMVCKIRDSLALAFTFLTTRSSSRFSASTPPYPTYHASPPPGSPSPPATASRTTSHPTPKSMSPRPACTSTRHSTPTRSHSGRPASWPPTAHRS